MRCDAHTIAISPSLEVTAGRSYVLEFAVDSDRLPLQVAIRSADERDELIQTQTNEPNRWSNQTEARFFLRFTSQVDRIRIVVSQTDARAIQRSLELSVVAYDRIPG